MTAVLPANAATASPLIEHLATWGEVAACEVRRLAGAATWIDVLRSAEVIEEICDEAGEPVGWSLTRKGEALLDAKPEAAARLALFQTPSYRAYLVGILAEGVALAAKADMRAQLEAWSGAELEQLLPEVNGTLDRIEAASGRLIDASRSEIERRCADLPGRMTDFSGWDQVLLGRAGRAQDLFDFVLRKFTPLAMLPRAPQGDGLAVVLRPLPTSADDRSSLGQTLKPGGWNIRRCRVHSGVSLFDHDGRYLFNPDLPAGEVLRPALQDALIDHPFYKAVVNLAICAWRSPATTLPSVELIRPANADLCDVTILVGSRDAGLLRERLPELVSHQGVRVRGLPNRVVARELMENVLRGLLEHEILRQVEDQIQLHPDYQSTLMAGRLRTVYRPGKRIQKHMVDALREAQNRTAAPGEVCR